jgi:hypothetical protein
MTFRDMMQADLDAIFTADEFEQQITYNGATVRALVGAADSFEDNRVNNYGMSITVRKTEVPTPAAGDSVVIDGTSYRVAEDPAPQHDLVWDVPLERNLVTL